MITARMVAAVVLAAGFSSRMGRPKALLPAGPGGVTFLARIVGTLRRGGLERVVVVVGVDGQQIQTSIKAAALSVEAVENPDPSRGQLSSLLVALATLEEAEAVLVIPVDQPLVTAETVARLIRVHRETHAPVVRPCRGLRHGHPAIFDRSVFEELRRADISRGARDVIAAHIAEVVDVEVDDEGAFVDIDTPEQYERVFGVRLAGQPPQSAG
jgi:molybdenum cofactor cytidylyltransferase